MMSRYPGELWKELLGGCNYNMYLGCNETTTSQYYSELTGMETVEVKTKRKTLKTIRLTKASRIVFCMECAAAQKSGLKFTTTPLSASTPPDVI